jgi:hypothetical protein
MTKDEIHIRFTDAPESYDYSNTTTVATVGKMTSGINKGKDLRKVAIRSEYSLRFQEGRYCSGMNLCVDLKKLEEIHDLIGIVDLTAARKDV